MSTAPRSPSRRLRRPAPLMLALAGILLLGACTHQRQVPDSYGEGVERRFIESCIDSMTQRGPDPDGVPAEDLGDSEPFTSEQARQVCTCSYEGISGPDGISFERFKEIYDAQETEPGPLPDEILTIVAACRGEVSPR